MNDNYYIPTVDEFHVGFEYERASYGGKLLAGTPIKKEWIECKLGADLYDINDVLDLYNEGKYSTNLRVKYLDREDVESLGFKYDNNGEPYPEREPVVLSTTKGLGHVYHSFQAFNLDTQLIDGVCYIMYLYSDKTVWIEWIKDCAGMGYIFKGTIKNKSELVKVLKQLNIL